MHDMYDACRVTKRVVLAYELALCWICVHIFLGNAAICQNPIRTSAIAPHRRGYSPNPLLVVGPLYTVTSPHPTLTEKKVRLAGTIWFTQKLNNTTKRKKNYSP